MHPVIHTVVRGTKVSYFLPFPLFEAKLWYVNPSKPFKKHTWIWEFTQLFTYSRLWNRRTPLNKRSPPPIKFQHQNFNSFLHQTRHCGRFSFFFSKINKRTPMFIPESRVVIFSLFWRFGKNEKSLWDLATFMYWTSMQILWTEVCVPFLLNLRVSKRKSINRSFSQAQRQSH